MAKLSRNRRLEGDDRRPEARDLAETVETTCAQRDEEDHLFDLAQSLFDDGLTAATHHRGYFSTFEISLLLTLGISMSTFASTTVFESSGAMAGVSLLSCALAFLMGKLIELNSFFGQTLARQQADFSRVFFGRADCLKLFRVDGNRPEDLAGKTQVWSDGEILGSISVDTEQLEAVRSPEEHAAEVGLLTGQRLTEETIQLNQLTHQEGQSA